MSKLVRDLIPDIIRSKSETPIVTVATNDQYLELLRAKLLEEVKEFLDSDNDPKELADIAEVLSELATHLKFDLDAGRKEKNAKSGSFSERFVLHGKVS
jgi:predicted house-cleaning noncanonical NTP pyrophosphatase (MazG superfamily)